ncbi:uncharacterized protein BJ171DRAFT_590145 [Polychytrium aggregatum]|uniref:uncharacterized protein n=1 Tax=Polychytrium aggregatum TaxID=110093 RepID=UPI0022FEEB8B|nr:uncharacterized protein BJ171DRAFT_590145 [Polychytrium aggregatum]KAI9192942.1 hypothetical protein BJ171DRAFT_590145 [Polychytrium aggregatum]
MPPDDSPAPEMASTPEAQTQPETIDLTDQPTPKKRRGDGQEVSQPIVPSGQKPIETTIEELYGDSEMYPNPPDVEAEKNWAIEIAAKEERGEACEADYMSLTFDEITYRRFRLVFALRGHRVRCSRCADRKQASWHLDQDDHDIVCKNNMMSPDNPAKIKECGHVKTGQRGKQGSAQES